MYFLGFSIKKRCNYPFNGGAERTTIPSMELKSHIGQRLRIARKRAGLTQANLAERLQKSVETLSNLERGNALTSLETLSQLALSLDVPLEYFVSGFSKEPTTKREAALARMQLEAGTLNDSELELAIRLVAAIRA